MPQAKTASREIGDEVDAVDIAAHMLGAPDLHSGTRLHSGLFDAITKVNELAHVAGSALRSRQTIASIIVAWEEANPGQDLIGD